MKINKYPKKGYSTMLSFLNIFLICSFFFVRINVEHSIEVYVYNFPNFYSLENIKNYFHHTFEAEATIYYRYLNDSYYLDEFLKIVSLLIEEGVPIIPPDFCVPCEMEKDWKETYIRYSCPLLLYFRDGNLTSIVISRFDPNVLFQAFIYSEESVKVFLRDDLIYLLKDDARMRIEDLLKGRKEVSMEFLSLLPIIVMAALIDAA
ncbi:hypothetical protein KEJ34_01190 [Candidatus Bathyarchaeota archaeon]|nr:hypothetical protein [Candidatus Bathyarchaeota archaeon]